MENQFENNDKETELDEELRRERRKQRIAEMKRQKERSEQIQQMIRKYGVYAGAVLLAVVVICVGVSLSRKNAEAKENEILNAEADGTEMMENDVSMSGESVEAGISADATMAAENGLMVVNSETDDVEGNTQIAPEPEEDNTQEEKTEPASQTDAIPVGDVTFWNGYIAEAAEDVSAISTEDVLSQYAVLIDANAGKIVAQRDAKTIINPASMTKVLTVLVAAEHVTDLDDTFTMNLEITDYAYVNDCSSVGFLDQEVVTVRDLLYGTILPSGGDAAVALATYVAGSHEAFVDMMNEKLEELGLSETAHFTNCVGLYDEDHYCTVYDMAIIMKAAMENELCREVMSARIYTTSATEQHPEGITISNWFIRRIEDKDTGGQVLCAKTGYVAQSGSCAASYGISDEGTPYICVTAQAHSSWRCIYDHVALYSKYTE